MFIEFFIKNIGFWIDCDELSLYKRDFEMRRLFVWFFEFKGIKIDDRVILIEK